MKYLEIIGTFLAVICFLIFPICILLGLCFAGFSDHREAWDTPVHHVLETIPWIILAIGIAVVLIIWIYDILVNYLKKFEKEVRKNDNFEE